MYELSMLVIGNIKFVHLKNTVLQSITAQIHYMLSLSVVSTFYAL